MSRTRVSSASIRRAIFFLPIVMLVACGGSDEPAPRPQAADMAIMDGARERARRDSIELAAAAFSAEGRLVVTMNQGEDSVSVDEHFRLRKSAGGEFVTEPISRTVRGDSTLLGDMYSFRDSRGGPRDHQSSTLAGLSFGSDFLALLGRIGSEGDDRGYRVEGLDDSAGGRCHRVRFVAGEESGRFWVGADSAVLHRMEIVRESDYGVGSYSYRMTADFTRPLGTWAIPERMSTRFRYRRLFSTGTGSVTATLYGVRSSDAAP